MDGLLLSAIREIVMCTALSGVPQGCIAMDHPAAALYPTRCPLPDAAALGYREGHWRGKGICWRPDGARGVRIIGGDDAPAWVEVSAGQAACMRVWCQPQQPLQTGARAR
jgi:hypothetical protein